MRDLIERQKAIDEIEERKNANGYRNVAVISELNRLEGYIMRLPSAQPEIIHCQECTNARWDNIFHQCWCRGRLVTPDHYCGYAERRAE